MATVYILYSETGDHFYIGSCKELEFRFQDHLNKKYKDSFTSKYQDWEIYLEIQQLEYQQARKIERHIKRMKSKKYIRDLKKI